MTGTAPGQRQRRTVFSQKAVRTEIDHARKVLLGRYQDTMRKYGRRPDPEWELTARYRRERIKYLRDRAWLSHQALWQEIWEAIEVDKVLTWADVAADLEVSRQTLQKKFKHQPPGSETVIDLTGSDS